MRRIIGLLIFLIGVLSVNATPFVPHHHHDGKICVEQTDVENQSSTESNTDNFHSEEGEYDEPRVDLIIDCDPIALFLLCLHTFSFDGVQTLISLQEFPESNRHFRWVDFTTESQELRGSPIFS